MSPNGAGFLVTRMRGSGTDPDESLGTAAAVWFSGTGGMGAGKIAARPDVRVTKDAERLI